MANKCALLLVALAVAVIFPLQVVRCSYLHDSTWSRYNRVRPVDVMVDMTNRLAANILFSHSILNENNIAFSPCGLASVLIALYEGADGRSALEIHEALGLPWDRDIVRIGYRDVHRRFRTYYQPQETFLSGLSLNNVSVNFTQEYKTILKFYGYDFEPAAKANGTDSSDEHESTTNKIETTELTTEHESDNSTKTVTTIKTDDLSTLLSNSNNNENYGSMTTESKDTKDTTTHTNDLTTIEETTTNVQEPTMYDSNTRTTVPKETTSVVVETTKLSEATTIASPITTGLESTYDSNAVVPVLTTTVPNTTTTSELDKVVTNPEKVFGTTIFTENTTVPKPTSTISTTETTTTELLYPATPAYELTTNINISNNVSVLSTLVPAISAFPVTSVAVPEKSTFIISKMPTINSQSSDTTISPIDGLMAPSISDTSNIVNMLTTENPGMYVENTTNSSLTNSNINNNLITDNPATLVSAEDSNFVPRTTIKYSVRQPTYNSILNIADEEFITPFPETEYDLTYPSNQDIDYTNLETSTKISVIASTQTLFKPIPNNYERESTQFSRYTESPSSAFNKQLVNNFETTTMTLEDDILSLPLPSSFSMQSDEYINTRMSYNLSSNYNFIPSENFPQRDQSRSKKSVYDYHASNRYAFMQPSTFYESFNSDNRLIEHPFYINHYQTVQVPYVAYNNILQFAYIEQLRASAVRLDLESSNHHLIIMLPEFEYDINTLVDKLRQDYAPTLRDIQKKLRHTKVKGLFPNFILDGFVSLTSDLQNLGIRSVFEPSWADFSPMTDDKDIYVRNVEQYVTVVINIQAASSDNSRASSSFIPTEDMVVNRPFVFFVVDSDIDIALVMGRVVNPVSTRIQ